MQENLNHDDGVKEYGAMRNYYLWNSFLFSTNLYERREGDDRLAKRDHQKNSCGSIKLNNELHYIIYICDDKKKMLF